MKEGFRDGDCDVEGLLEGRDDGDLEGFLEGSSEGD